MIFDNGNRHFRIRAESVPRFDTPTDVLPEDIPEVFDALALQQAPLDRVKRVPLTHVKREMPNMRRLYPNVFRGLRKTVNTPSVQGSDMGLMGFAELCGSLDGRFAQEAQRRRLISIEDQRLRGSGAIPGPGPSRALRCRPSSNSSSAARPDSGLFRSQSAPGLFANERHTKEAQHKPVFQATLTPAPDVQQHEVFRLDDKPEAPRAGGLHVTRHCVEWCVPRTSLERRHHGLRDGPPARDVMLSSPRFEAGGEPLQLRIWPDGMATRMCNSDGTGFTREKMGWCTLGLLIFRPGAHLRVRFFIGAREAPYSSSNAREIYSDEKMVWPSQFFDPEFPRPTLRNITDSEDHLVFGVEILENCRDQLAFARKKKPFVTA